MDASLENSILRINGMWQLECKQKSEEGIFFRDFSFPGHALYHVGMQSKNALFSEHGLEILMQVIHVYIYIQGPAVSE